MPRARSRASLAAAAALASTLVMAAAPLTASAAPAARGGHALAVVEVRSGSTQLPGLGERLAALARRVTNLSVLGPADARKGSSLDVDGAVARCAGEAGCLAGVGGRLGVRALLVVAVSQLGDVIVALEVVNVEGHSVTGRHAESLPPGAGLSDDDLHAWLERLLPPEAFVLYGTLTVRANVAGADVEIDGERRGRAPLGPLSLVAPHTYKIRITKAGHVPWTTKVDLNPAPAVEVLATLQRENVPVWKRPWFWAVVAGGLGAGAFAGVRLTTHDPSTVDGRAVVVRGGM